MKLFSNLSLQKLWFYFYLYNCSTLLLTRLISKQKLEEINLKKLCNKQKRLN